MHTCIPQGPDTRAHTARICPTGPRHQTTETGQCDSQAQPERRLSRPSFSWPSWEGPAASGKVFQPAWDSFSTLLMSKKKGVSHSPPWSSTDPHENSTKGWERRSSRKSVCMRPWAWCSFDSPSGLFLVPCAGHLPHLAGWLALWKGSQVWAHSLLPERLSGPSRFYSPQIQRHSSVGWRQL